MIGRLRQQVAVCGGHHNLAIKTDGTLWGWGFNAFGQLGLGDITHRPSPVQIGSRTDWSDIEGVVLTL